MVEIGGIPPVMDKTA
jgi:hypothetical protein